MKKVFVSGSMSIKKLDGLVLESLNKIMSLNMRILVGNARGVDKLVQEYCVKNSYYNVVVYSIRNIHRNLIPDKFGFKWISAGNLTGRKAYEKKDEAMTRDSDYSFVIWDGKSKGSLNNIIRAIKSNQKIKVFYQKDKRFLEKHELSKLIYILKGRR